MLAARTRRRGFGGKGSEEGPSVGGSLHFWGATAHAAGYAQPTCTEFPQASIGLSDIVQVETGSQGAFCIRADRSVLSWAKDSYGALGNTEYPLDSEGTNRGIFAVPVPGNQPMYVPEFYEEKKVPFEQGTGKLGPIVPPAVAIAGGAQQRYILTGAEAGYTNPLTKEHSALSINKRVLAFGASALGNGYSKETAAGKHTESVQAAWEGGKWKPQYAPYWVLTGPGPVEGPASNERGQQNEAPGGSNVLSGVRAIAGAKGVGLFLMESGSVYLTGGMAKFTEQTDYATLDGLWESARAGAKPIAICGNTENYGLLMPDGTVHVVGEGQGLWQDMFGDGTNSSSRGVHTVKREVSPGIYATLDKIIALVCCQYSYFALDSQGVVWTWGGNQDGQLGLGLQFTDHPGGSYAKVKYATPITALNEGGRSVLAISAGGKDEQLATGSVGGQSVIALLDNKTIRSWGFQYLLRHGRTLHGDIIASCGDGTTMTRNAPVNPSAIFPSLTNIIGIAGGMNSQVVIKSPAEPGQPSLSVTNPSSGVVRVEWREMPEGLLTAQRREEGWRVSLKAGGGLAYNSGNLPQNYNEVKPGTNSPEAGSRVHAYTFTGVTPANYTASMKGVSLVEQELPIVGGNKQNASGGKLAIEWGDPPLLPVPGFYILWHRAPGAEKDTLKTALTNSVKAGERIFVVNAIAGFSATDIYKIGGSETPGTGEYVEVAANGVEKTTHEVEVTEPFVENHEAGEPVYLVVATEEPFTRSALLPAAARSYTITLNPSPQGLTNEELTLKGITSETGTYKTRELSITTT